MIRTAMLAATLVCAAVMATAAMLPQYDTFIPCEQCVVDSAPQWYGDYGAPTTLSRGLFTAKFIPQSSNRYGEVVGLYYDYNMGQVGWAYWRVGSADFDFIVIDPYGAGPPEGLAINRNGIVVVDWHSMWGPDFLGAIQIALPREGQASELYPSDRMRRDLNVDARYNLWPTTAAPGALSIDDANRIYASLTIYGDDHRTDIPGVFIPTPEPSTIVLIGLGLALFAGAKCRRLRPGNLF